MECYVVQCSSHLAVLVVVMEHQNILSNEIYDHLTSNEIYDHLTSLYT